MFAIPAIANQQVNEANLLVPGEGSFGSAYQGTIVQIGDYLILTALAHSGVYYVSRSERQDVLQPPKPPDYTSQDAYYIQSYPKVDTVEYVSGPIPNRFLGTHFIIDDTTTELNQYAALPPGTVDPENIDIAPYIICADRRSVQLPLAITYLINDGVSVPFYGTHSVNMYGLPSGVVLDGYTIFRTTRESIIEANLINFVLSTNGTISQTTIEN